VPPAVHVQKLHRAYERGESVTFSLTTKVLLHPSLGFPIRILQEIKLQFMQHDASERCATRDRKSELHEFSGTPFHP
jgi:hypothetical protein